jgi:AraC-like DNA-binding protein
MTRQAWTDGTDRACSVHGKPPADPLAAALRRKAATGAPGTLNETRLASGDGWRVADMVCTSGPGDEPFEERAGGVSVSLVLAGTFVFRSDRGSSLLSAGSLLLMNAGQTFECSHQHGEGDRCLSFRLDPDLFEQVAGETGAVSAHFDHNRLPPSRAFAGLAARAKAAMAGRGSFDELVLGLARTAIRAACSGDREPKLPSARDHARIARVLRQLESDTAAPASLAELARVAGLSRYHFLRTFKRVTGVTPHQWLLRARLVDAANRLATSREPVTEIALDAGFEDLSHFIHSFRAEFGVSPRRFGWLRDSRRAPHGHDKIVSRGRPQFSPSFLECEPAVWRQAGQAPSKGETYR